MALKTTEGLKTSLIKIFLDFLVRPALVPPFLAWIFWGTHDDALLQLDSFVSIEQLADSYLLVGRCNCTSTYVRVSRL